MDMGGDSLSQAPCLSRSCNGMPPGTAPKASSGVNNCHEKQGYVVEKMHSCCHGTKWNRTDFGENGIKVLIQTHGGGVRASG